MSFATRLCAFAVILLVSMESWWNTPTDDLTPLALKQFQSDASVPQQIQQKTLAQNYGPLLWPALALALGVAMFWAEIERWWKEEDVLEQPGVPGNAPLLLEDHSCEKPRSP